MQERKTSHLKVVSSRPELPSAAIVTDPPRQLSLPYPDPYTVLVAHVESLRPESFLKVVDTLRPRWIVDARITPRMDVIAGSRSHAFSMFHAFQIEYVDLFGNLGLTTYRNAEINPALWVEDVGQLIKRSRHPIGPFIVLFDNWELLSAARLSFASSFGRYLGREVSVIQLA